MFGQNLRSTLSAAVWNIVFCKYAVKIVTMSTWLHSVLKADGFSCGRPVRAVVHGECHKALPCWLMMCDPMNLKAVCIVYHTLSTHITKKADYNKQTPQTGAVTLSQQYGSVLNLNIYFHMLYLNGICAENSGGKTRLDDEHPCSPL
jgi:hypothetical protein